MDAQILQCYWYVGFAYWQIPDTSQITMCLFWVRSTHMQHVWLMHHVAHTSPVTNSYTEGLLLSVLVPVWFCLPLPSVWFSRHQHVATPLFFCVIELCSCCYTLPRFLWVFWVFKRYISASTCVCFFLCFGFFVSCLILACTFAWVDWSVGSNLATDLVCKLAFYG